MSESTRRQLHLQGRRKIKNRDQLIEEKLRNAERICQRNLLARSKQSKKTFRQFAEKIRETLLKSRSHNPEESP